MSERKIDSANRRDRTKSAEAHAPGALRRRDFLISGVAALGSGALAGPGFAGSEVQPQTAQPQLNELGEPRIRNYRALGKTGLEISDISYGSSRTTDPEIVAHALERGVNYFDAAESYNRGRSEESIGEALAGKRDRVILTSKTEISTTTTKAELMERLEGSLRRLRTDYIDVYFNHAVNDVELLKNDEWHEFTAAAKQQGKIRFVGVSGHGGQLVRCLDYALDRDLIDVILCAYNFGQDPAFYQRFVSRLDFIAIQTELPRVIDKAHAKGVGVVAMKTLRGARLNDMRPYEGAGTTFAQAAFRWVLSNPKISGLVISMTSHEQVDEFVAASGGSAPRGAELDLLEEYLLANRRSYCDHGCDICESSCPVDVAISDVLRTRMYARDYGDLPYARAEYSRLGLGLERGAAACLACADTPCLGRCPTGLDIPNLMRDAATLLG